MDGGMAAVHAVSQNNVFQPPHYLQQISNGHDNQITGFVPNYRQSAFAHYLAKDELTQLAGSALPSTASNENVQNMHHGKPHQYVAPCNFSNASKANVRPPGFSQHPSRASRTSPSNQDYISTPSKTTQSECQQHQLYYAPLHYKHAHQRFQQISHTAMQSQTDVVNRPCVTTNGFGQSTYVCHQPLTFVASQMTLDSEKQASKLSKPLHGPPAVPHKEGALLPKTPLDTENRVHPIPNKAPNCIPSPRTAPVDFKEGESYASALFQITSLQRILGDGHAFATSKSATVGQNPSAAGRIQMPATRTANGLNSIIVGAIENADLPLNPMGLSTAQGNGEVTVEDLIKLHKEMMATREQFIHLLMGYKKKYLEIKSVNNDKSLPAARVQKAKARHDLPSGTQNRVHPIPNKAPNNTPSPRTAPVDFKEGEPSVSFQITSLQRILGDGHAFATSKSCATVGQNPSAAGRIPMPATRTANGLNSIIDSARENVHLAMNPVGLSTAQGNGEVTVEELNKLYKEIMAIRKPFIHLLKDYRNKCQEFKSANSDKPLPASHVHGSNILKRNGENVPDANKKSILPDNCPNFQSPPATLSSHGGSKQFLTMSRNSFQDNQTNQNVHVGIDTNENSSKGSHPKQTSLGNSHESNQIDKALQVMDDCSTMSASISLSSTSKEKLNLDNSQMEICQQSKQKNNLFISNTTNFHDSYLSHDITFQANPVQPNVETASTSPPQLNSLCLSPSGLSTGVAVRELQKKTPHSNKSATNQKLQAVGKEIGATDSQSKKPTKRCRKSAGLRLAPRKEDAAIRQLKDISSLDDRWKKQPSKVDEISSKMCPNVYPRPNSSSETFQENCTEEYQTSQNIERMSSSNDRHPCTSHTVVGQEPETSTSSVTLLVESSSVVENQLTNFEIEGSNQGDIPQMPKIGRDVQETFSGQLPTLNEKDMSLSHHYRVTINSLLDKLDSYSTLSSADTEEINPEDDSSKSENVIQIKTEPCESVTENAKVDSSESGNVLQIKSEPCESERDNTKFENLETGNVMQTKTETCDLAIKRNSLHSETCVLSEPQSSPSCPKESSQFHASDVPLLLVEDVADSHIQIENVCSLAEGSTFYKSQFVHAFDINKVPESHNLDALSDNIVTPQSNVQTSILTKSQCFGESKGLSNLPVYTRPSQTSETNAKEGNVSCSQEEHTQLSLATAQPLEENIWGKDDDSEPCLYSQLSELLRDFPFGIQQTEGGPLTKVDVQTEKKGMNDSQLVQKEKEHKVQKSNIPPQNRLSAQSLLMNKSSGIGLDECSSTEINKELRAQIESKHSSVDKCDYTKSATVGHMSVTVVDSKQIAMNVIETPTEPGEEISLNNNQDVPTSHSESKIIIEANEQLGDPISKHENIPADSDDEVIWVKTEVPTHSKSTAAKTANIHNDGSVVESLDKNVCLGSVHPEINKKSNYKDSPLPKTPDEGDHLVGPKKGKMVSSRLIVRTDFLKSKYSRSVWPIQTDKIKLLNRKTSGQGVNEGCKNDKFTATNLSSENTGSGIKNTPAAGDKSLSTAVEEKLLMENVCAGKSCKDMGDKSDIENNSSVDKDNIHAQAIDHLQCRREKVISAGKKIPTGKMEAKCHNTSPLTPYEKPSVDLGKLKRPVMQASEKDFQENVPKLMQSMEMTENNMSAPTATGVTSPTAGDLNRCVKPNRLVPPESDSTSKLIVGHNYRQEMSIASSTKSTEHTGTDFLKRVTYSDISDGMLQLSPFDFPSRKESARKRKQVSFEPPLTEKPQTPITPSVSGERQMLEFQVCRSFLQAGRLAADDSTRTKHRAGVENGSQKGIDSKTDNCSNIPFKKRKVSMAEFHGNAVLQESPTMGQTMPTDATAAFSSQDLFNTYKKMYLEKQKADLVNPS